tara:strand:- start:3059 stop:3955 length:897 start_codon:yes stop_codon:yes gene_type:complete
MKTLSIYTTEDELKFDFTKVTENTWAPLTDLQSERTGLVEVFDGVMFTTLIEGYTIFNIRQSKRAAVKAEALESEFNFRVKKLAAQDIPLDMDILLEEVNVDLTRMSNITTKDYLTVYDHKGKRFIVDGQRGKGEDVMHLMHNLFQEDEEGNTASFEVLMTEPFIMQDILTKYVLDPKLVPEPLIIGEKIKIGAKTAAGKKSTSSNITITKEDVTASEFTEHLTERRAVHSLELDNDGIIYATVDHTFMISSLKYEGSLKYKEDLALDECDNWVTEYTQILPEISKFVNLLEKELIGE